MKTRAILCCSVTALIFSHAHAANWYWDADADTTAATGGTGNWTLADALWRSGSATGSLTAYNDAAGPHNDTAANLILAGGTDGPTMTLTASAAYNLNKITANNSYTLATNTAVPTFVGTTPTVEVASSKTLTWGTDLSAANSTVTKTGAGIWLFNNTGGQVTSNNTTLDVTTGTLQFNTSAASANLFTGTGGIVKVGSSDTLSLVQTYVGSYVGARTWTLGSKVIMNGGTFNSGGSTGALFMRLTSGTAIQVDAASTIAQSNGSYGQNITIEGTVTGTGNLNLNRAAAATSSNRYVNIKGSMSGYSGNVTIGTSTSAGYVLFGHSSGWGTGNLSLTGAGSRVMIGDEVATTYNANWTGGSGLAFTTGTFAPAGIATVGSGAELTVMNTTASYGILFSPPKGLVVNGGTLALKGTAGTSAFVPATGSTWSFGGTALSTISGAIKLNNASATFQVADALAGSAVDTRITGVISGTNGFSKSGAGTLALSAANTYSGTATVKAGTLQVDFGTGGTSNILPPGAAVSLGGGTLEVLGGSGETNTQDLNGVGGGGTMLLTANGASSVNLAMGAVTATAGINFTGASTTVSSGTAIAGNLNYTTTSIAGVDDATTILGANLWNGSNWASTAYDGISKTHVVPWQGSYSDIYNGTNPGPVGIPSGTPSADVRILEASGDFASNTLSADDTINSLLMVAGTTPATIDMDIFSLTVGSNVAGVGAVAIGASARSLTIGSVVDQGILTAGTSAAASSLVLNNANPASLLTVNSVIADNFSTGVVSLFTSGMVIVNGTNTYTGTTTVSGGTLQIGSGGTTGTLGSGDVTNDGSLVINRSDSYTYGGLITGLGSLTTSGAGTIVLTGNNNYSGATTINAGTLQIGNGGTTGTPGSGDVITNGQLTFNRSDSFTYDGSITGTGKLGKAGSGTLILTGTNTYAGTTIISGGTLQLGNGGATGSPGSGAITNDGTLAINRTGTISIGNLINGTGNMHVTTPGTLMLSTTNGYSGGTVVNNGIVQADANDALGTGKITIGQSDISATSHSLRLNGVTMGNAVDSKFMYTADYLGTITAIGGSPSTINGAVAIFPAVAGASSRGGHLASFGAGSVLRLMGTLDVSGGQTVITHRDGTVEYGGGGSTVFNLQVTGTARLFANDGISTLANITLGVSAAATFDLNGFDQTVEALIKGANSASVINNGATPSVLTLGASANRTFSGTIADGTSTIALVKQGSSTLILNGANSYSGTTTVDMGTLAGNGSASSALSVAATGTLAPGDGIGTYAATGATFATGSTLAIQINSSTINADKLVATAPVDITGANVTFADLGGATLPPATKLVILDYTGTTLSGAPFSGYPEGSSVSIGANTFTISYADASRVTLTISSGYGSWAGDPLNGLTAGVNDGAGQDPDNDGIDNVLEYILGGKPLANDTGILPVPEKSGSNLILTYKRADDSKSDTVQVIEYGDNLSGWTAVTVPAASGDVAGVTFTIDEGTPISEPDTVVVSIPAGTAPGFFARLKATKP